MNGNGEDLDQRGRLLRVSLRLRNVLDELEAILGDEGDDEESNDSEN